jgi:hypothetical protein
MFSVFIPGNVPSSKNSKVWTGKFLVHSKPTRKWIKETKPYFIRYCDEFRKVVGRLEKPVFVEFVFVRNSRRLFDYLNPAQTVQDQMVTHGWLEDDNCDILLPSFGKYAYDKHNSGVYINVLNTNTQGDFHGVKSERVKKADL